MENQAPDIKDYLKIIKRRRKFLLIPFVIILTISSVLAVILPPVFQSTATILIEEQEIPPDLVRSTVTTFADQRIKVISQRIITRPNLNEIIQKFDLYPELRKKKSEEVILKKMRDSLKIDTISADVGGHSGGSKATIAFTLAFDDENAGIAQKVANELTSLFLKENIKSRTESAENTMIFLHEESKRLKDKIQEIQTDLATFKGKNLDQLPHINQLNQQELNGITNQLLGLDNQEVTLKERKLVLESELAQIDPDTSGNGSVPSLKDRLKQLESLYPSLRASFSENHPDVLKAKREMESIKKEIGSDNTNLNKINDELIAKKNELATILKQYSEKHPDVIRLQKQIASLQQTMVATKETELTDSRVQPENPAYISLTVQLKSIDSEIDALNRTRNQLRQKMDTLRQSIREAPVVEKEFTDLLQELDNSNSRYREVSAREMEASIAQQLEIERKGERFTLIDPPQAPIEPISPNRKAIFLLGFIFALVASFGVVALMEMSNATVNSETSIANILGVKPLSSIPYLQNKIELDAVKKRHRILIIGAIISAILAVIGFHFLILPLDVFWFKLLSVI
ncbi:MAG: Wzz/FepE/Etk N-terminal domain-containing protein [Methylococcaceae bacterium]